MRSGIIVWRAIVIALSILSTTHNLIASALASDDSMRNGRMNACVKLLQRNDKALRNSWRGHCGADELDKEIASTPDNGSDNGLIALFATGRAVEVVDDGACKDDVVPIAKSAKCGFGSDELYESLRVGAAMKLRLPGPGNKCASFIPILISNKTDFACNAVKSRIACVDASYDDKTDRTTITFSAKRTTNTVKTTIEFGRAELDQAGGRLSALLDHPQFTIMPSSVDGAPLVDSLVGATNKQEKTCNGRNAHSPAGCRRLARYQADANMQEAVRHYRNPRNYSSKDAMKNDAVKLLAYLKSKGIDGIQEQWILFLSVAANEVGLDIDNGTTKVHDPIYGVSDAVYGNSGLSFGAHQIDLGANEDNELQLFWRVVEAYKTAHPDATLDQAKLAKDCVDLPLRLMTVAALSLTYQASPKMTVALRSDEGFEEYNRRLLDYLAEEIRITSAKTGLFQKSMITRILFSDLRNQVGSGRQIQALVDDEMANGLDFNSCSDITGAENTMLSKLIWNEPADHSKGKTQYAIRYENIRNIVRDAVPDGGVTGCH